MSRQAIVVVDLGFGDSGKGTMTDALVRQTGASTVVRFNGGAQAGHTVVLDDGRFHTFSQLGAGSFVAGVRTHLSRFMVVHPGGLLREAEVLAGKGVPDILHRVSVSDQALVITPFQQAANRLREILRGEGRHGSCGLGIGETMADALEDSEGRMVAGDLAFRERLRPKLLRLQQHKWSLFAEHFRQLRKHPQGALEVAVLESADVAERWMDQAAHLASQVAIGPDRLPSSGPVIFEGAQGVLLDEWRGFHPHTTWSTCTFANALELLEGWDGEVTRLGVLRSYATRHGAGPFPTEEASVDFAEPHNALGPWQGGFRQGWFDAVLARYAIDCCGGVDGLALTHLDRVDDRYQMAVGYEDMPAPYYVDGRVALGPDRDLEYQEELGRSLAGATPVLERVRLDEVPSRIAEALGAPVLWESRGPRACDKRESRPLARSGA